MTHSFHACQTDVTKATFDKDIFEREKYADNLTLLVKNTTCPYVIALASPWGSGKTFFLNAWRNKIAWQKESKKEDGKIPCAYFSAWEAENEADPLVSVVSSIRSCLLDGSLISSKKENGLFEKTVKVIRTPSILFKGATALTKGIVNHYTYNALDDIGADMAEKMGEGYFEKLDELQQDKIDFSQELKKTIDAVKEKTNTPILVMIDELDRCKPDYVILLLERIKHLFQVSGLVFVLAIDKEQLLSVIEHTFGIKEVQRDVYLEKFIDIYYELPAPNIMEYARNLIIFNFDEDYNYIESLEDEHESLLIHLDKKNTSNLHIYYCHMSLFQKVLLGIVENYFKGDSVRSFEKKFYKFETINNIYNPNFVLSILLFYVIISDSTLDNLFSKKSHRSTTTNVSMHSAIISFIFTSISDDYGIRVTYEPYEYSIFRGDSKSRPYTSIGKLYTKYINDYKQSALYKDTELINRRHIEGLATLRNQLQEMLDFGKNIEKA